MRKYMTRMISRKGKNARIGLPDPDAWPADAYNKLSTLPPVFNYHSNIN